MKDIIPPEVNKAWINLRLEQCSDNLNKSAQETGLALINRVQKKPDSFLTALEIPLRKPICIYGLREGKEFLIFTTVTFINLAVEMFDPSFGYIKCEPLNKNSDHFWLPLNSVISVFTIEEVVTDPKLIRQIKSQNFNQLSLT